MFRRLFLTLCCFALASLAHAGDLTRGVRYKLSAGDLPSGIAAVEDYRNTTGADAEYLDAIGWLARGAEMLRRPDLAREYVTELRRAIPHETPELLVPLGAAIEVEGKLIASRDGRGAAIRFLEQELATASATSLRSRIMKNINALSLEGQPALPLDRDQFVGAPPPTEAAMRGKPVLLFFWAQGCGDCKAQSVSLGRIWEKYRTKGLLMLTATRLYGSVDDKPATPVEEKARIAKVWAELYGKLDGVSAIISTDTMVRYGVSATPTFALIDRDGVIRYYTPTRVSEAELSKRIDEVLAETTTRGAQ